jgi:hypothetical protein
MKATSRPPQKFRLTASNLAKYFANRCDRNFRWNTVAGPLRGKSGIGWNVPQKVRAHSRPGIALLMEAGNVFEGDHVQAFMNEYGEGAVLTAGIERDEDSCKVKELPFSDFVAAFRSEPFPQFVAQLEVVLDEDGEARLLSHFNLDASRVTFSPARPDLLEVLPPVHEDGKHRLRIWDFKASQKARHDHYIQVAYYSFILDHAIKEAGLANVEVDLEFAVIRSREVNDPPFELRPYRLAVDDFLRNRAYLLFQTPAADAHFHVTDHCAMCEYMDHCRDGANRVFDLSRIAYISSESKRRLRQSGISTHRELSGVADEEQIANLQSLSHDLSLNLPRYIATSQALEDGLPRSLHSTTLLMPRYEDIRVVLCAEQDAVTGTCFALGFKTYEGWDEANGKVIGDEQVFIAHEPNTESKILLEFLRALNALLRRIDAANREIASRPVEDVPGVLAATGELAQAEAQLAEFKLKCPVLRRTNPQHDALLAERTALQERGKESKAALKQARRDAEWELRKQQRSLHFYVYDSIDLFVLRGLIERHLFVEEPPELLAEITHLLRLFPPASVMQDAETFRTMPGTVVTGVLRSMVALPTPYVFDLKTVSEMYQPQNAEGEEKGYIFRPRYGFGWDFSSQVAYERIHDVWRNESFQPDARNPERVHSPEDIGEKLDETVRSKLRATDSVIRRLKQDFREQLHLRKQPFLLYSEFDPLNFRTLEALRTFSMLESSLAELAVKHLHSLPVEDRAAKFVCIRGLRYVPESEGADNSLWFTFDAASKDVKFEVGDFNLVLTPEDRPEVLLGDVDGKLFESNWGRADPFKVTLVEYDLQVTPPRVRLLPEKPDKFREHVDLTKPCALDQLYTDFTSQRILSVLRELKENPQNALHVHSLLRDGRMDEWQPVVPETRGIEKLFRESVALTGKDPRTFLNEGQWHAWRGVFGEPLTLIWGPPGTGKTHTVAHILIGYALAAQAEKKPLRILVTAFTHNAIVNVLRKLAQLARAYNLSPETLSIVKLTGSGNAADDELPPSVERLADEDLETCLQHEAQCIVAGGTVWSAYKGMKKSGGIIRPWFDVVLVDEASQMRLPDALVAFGASKAHSNIILAGDDQQLPPIIHGSYPEEHEYMLSSVFAFMRRQIEQASVEDPNIEAQKIFQLEENFRMNEPLTAYPRHVLYRGRFKSTRPEIRIQTAPVIDETSEEILDTILHPERPVVLCWYTSPRSFTARNPIEAELVALLTERLSRTLLQETKGKSPQPYSPGDFVRHGLAVLAPHRAQNSAIRQALARCGFDARQRPMPLVDTVEKMQGKEREVILVSYGVADEEYATAEAQFLLSRNRFNVAATRAERKLVVLCSDTVLDAVPTDRRTLLEAMMLKEFRHYCSDGRLQRRWTSSEGDEVTLNIQWKGF